MRTIGKSQNTLLKFCSIMDLPAPVNYKPFGNHTEVLKNAAKKVSGVTGPKTCVGIRIKFSCATTVTTNPLKSWNINHSGKSILVYS
jgi:hypothetical protein